MTNGQIQSAGNVGKGTRIGCMKHNELPMTRMLVSLVIIFLSLGLSIECFAETSDNRKLQDYYEYWRNKYLKHSQKLTGAHLSITRITGQRAQRHTDMECSFAYTCPGFMKILQGKILTRSRSFGGNLGAGLIRG